MKFGRYVALSRAGRGGMADVWKCWDPRLGRIVAVKILTRGTVQQFLLEAQLTARLDHPNIVKVYELGWHRSAPFLVMKYIDGAPLSRSPGASAIMAKVCDAVDYAHSRGVAHRDLKPSNILFDGEPRVIDFGISRWMDGRFEDIVALGETLRAVASNPNERIARAIRRATDPNPERRYARASEMAHDLR